MRILHLAGLWHAAGRISVGTCLKCADIRIEEKCIMSLCCLRACLLPYVVLVCWYWGGSGYGQCMLRILPGCCINMHVSLARALFVQASRPGACKSFCPSARPAKVMATGPCAAQWVCPSAELRTSAPCRSCYSDDLLCGGGCGMLQAGSPLGLVCSVQASALRKSASCPCVVCELACYRVVLVGCIIDLDEKKLRQKPHTIWRVHLAGVELAHRTKVHGHLLQVWLGHATSLFRFAPPLLSIFDKIYRINQSRFG